MALDDLITGLKAFDTGIKEMATTNAVKEATTQVNALNLQGLDMMQKQAEHMKIANNLALKLTGIGTDAAHIQTAFQAAAGQQAKNSKEMFMQAQGLGTPEARQAGMALAKQTQTFEEDPELKKLAVTERGQDKRLAAMVGAQSAKIAHENMTQLSTQIKHFEDKPEIKSAREGLGKFSSIMSQLDLAEKKNMPLPATTALVDLVKLLHGGGRVSENIMKQVSEARNPGLLNDAIRSGFEQAGLPFPKDIKAMRELTINLREDAAQNLANQASDLAQSVAPLGLDPEVAQKVLSLRYKSILGGAKAAPGSSDTGSSGPKPLPAPVGSPQDLNQFEIPGRTGQ